MIIRNYLKLPSMLRFLLIVLIFGLKPMVGFPQSEADSSGEPDLNGANILFEDEFLDSGNSWGDLDTRRCESEISDGLLKLKGKTAYSPAFLGKILNMNPEKDFFIEAKIRHTSGMKNMGFGLCWGSRTDHLDWFTFLISANGKYTILKKRREDYNEIKRWTESPIINGSNKDNVLTILKKGDRIKFYINHQLVYISNYEFFKGKKAGILFHGTMKLEVDYFVVKQMP